MITKRGSHWRVADCGGVRFSIVVFGNDYTLSEGDLYTLMYRANWKGCAGSGFWSRVLYPKMGNGNYSSSSKSHWCSRYSRSQEPFHTMTYPSSHWGENCPFIDKSMMAGGGGGGEGLRGEVVKTSIILENISKNCRPAQKSSLPYTFSGNSTRK